VIVDEKIILTLRKIQSQQRAWFNTKTETVNLTSVRELQRICAKHLSNSERLNMNAAQVLLCNQALYQIQSQDLVTLSKYYASEKDIGEFGINLLLECVKKTLRKIIFANDDNAEKIANILNDICAELSELMYHLNKFSELNTQNSLMWQMLSQSIQKTILYIGNKTKETAGINAIDTNTTSNINLAIQNLSNLSSIIRKNDSYNTYYNKLLENCLTSVDKALNETIELFEIYQ
jgi:uncharacterized protein (UPF0216 family)